MSDEGRLPRHIALIMDGNGRWAEGRGLSRSCGHREGVRRVEPIVRLCSDLGIESLTLYTLSTENLEKRPKDEISILMVLLREFFDQRLQALIEGNVRIRVLGDRDSLPLAQRALTATAEAATRGNTGLCFNVAFNYGAQAELLTATRSLARRAVAGEIAPERIQREDLEDALTTRGQPMVDLLIRTGGDMRLSNFLLYQCAYAELSFIEEFWPDFTLDVLAREIERFQTKERRFGGLTMREK